MRPRLLPSGPPPRRDRRLKGSDQLLVKGLGWNRIAERLEAVAEDESLLRGVRVPKVGLVREILDRELPSAEALGLTTQEEQ